MAMLVAFPGFFVALLAAERLATHALASNPASPLLWRASLELRALYREISNQLELISGHDLRIQIAFISVLFIALVLSLRTKRGPAICFLANHLLLFAGAFSTLIATNFSVASFGPASPTTSSLLFSLDLHLNLPQTVALAAGIAGSLYSHIVLLSAYRSIKIQN